jgi:hypothetical protein
MNADKIGGMGFRPFGGFSSPQRSIRPGAPFCLEGGHVATCRSHHRVEPQKPLD